MTAFVLELGSVLGDLLATQSADEYRLYFLRAGRRGDHQSRTSNSLDSEMAEHLFGRRVPARDDALSRGGDHGAVQYLEHYREEIMARACRGFPPLSHRRRLAPRPHLSGLARNS